MVALGPEEFRAVRERAYFFHLLLGDNMSTLYTECDGSNQMRSDRIAIIINGAPRAGKDAFAYSVLSVLNHVASGKNKAGVIRLAPGTNYSTIDTIKQLLANFGINTANKTARDRALLSNVKMALDSYNDFTTNQAVDKMNSALGVHFIHVREPSHIAGLQTRLRSAGVVSLTVHVDRPSLGNQPQSNESDASTSPRHFDYDVFVRNTGSLDDLNLLAMAFAEMLVDDHFCQFRQFYNSDPNVVNPMYRAVEIGLRSSVVAVKNSCARVVVSL